LAFRFADVDFAAVGFAAVDFAAVFDFAAVALGVVDMLRTWIPFIWFGAKSAQSTSME
jgi:hypothetical protein